MGTEGPALPDETKKIIHAYIFIRKILVNPFSANALLKIFAVISTLF